MKTVILVMSGLLVLWGCDDGIDDAPEADAGIVAIEGTAYFFARPGVVVGADPDDEPVEGAVVSVLDEPAHSVVVDADGHFRIEGLREGQEVTLGLEHPDYQPTLTATFTMGSTDLRGVSFQIVTLGVARLLANSLHADLSDPEHCNMVTTLTAAGMDIDVFAHGEPGATATVTPAPGSDSAGMVYFNEQVLPDARLSESSVDGGVIVANMQPGVYRWRGHKEGVEFNELTMVCRPGWLTNASPPYGLTAGGWAAP